MPLIEAAAPGVPNARWIAIRLLDGDAAVEEALTSGKLAELVARQQAPDAALQPEDRAAGGAMSEPAAISAG